MPAVSNAYAARATLAQLQLCQATERITHAASNGHGSADGFQLADISCVYLPTPIEQLRGAYSNPTLASDYGSTNWP